MKKGEEIKVLPLLDSFTRLRYLLQRGEILERGEYGVTGKPEGALAPSETIFPPSLIPRFATYLPENEPPLPAPFWKTLTAESRLWSGPGSMPILETCGRKGIYYWLKVR